MFSENQSWVLIRTSCLKQAGTRKCQRGLRQKITVIIVEDSRHCLTAFFVIFHYEMYT